MSTPGAFPKLLRRSRFASFDPTIRQSYGTPPSHLHRGNWGLKRPIAQRKRNAFISLKNFEEHENYIEWNNAETEVRLIDKIEELNIAPKLVANVPWFVGLGPAASSYWSKMDTEFAPGETGMPPLPNSVIPLFTTQLEGLGLRGKGEYGSKPSIKPTQENDYLHPNVLAMSPKVFARYVKKLRSLRPEFKKFLEENGVSTAFREAGLPLGNYHIRFLGQHFDKQYQDTLDEKNTNTHPNQPQPIRQQPDRLAGLTYATPTTLETFFNSAVLPAIVLEDGSKTYFTSTDTANSFLASTAGIIGRLDTKRAGPNVMPAFNNKGIAFPPAALLAGETKKNTFINVKVIDLQLERPPVAVTASADITEDRRINTDPLRSVKIRMDLVAHSSGIDHSRTNPHPPGSLLYNAPEDSQYPEQQKNLYTYHTTSMYKLDRLREYRVSPIGQPQDKNQLPDSSSHNDHMATVNKMTSSRFPVQPSDKLPADDQPQDDNNQLQAHNNDILVKLNKMRTSKPTAWNRPRKSKWKDDEMFAGTETLNYDDDDNGQDDGNNTPT